MILGWKRTSELSDELSELEDFVRRQYPSVALVWMQSTDSCLNDLKDSMPSRIGEDGLPVLLLMDTVQSKCAVRNALSLFHGPTNLILHGPTDAYVAHVLQAHNQTLVMQLPSLEAEIWARSSGQQEKDAHIEPNHPSVHILWPEYNSYILSASAGSHSLSTNLGQELEEQLARSDGDVHVKFSIQNFLNSSRFLVFKLLNAECDP